MEAEEEDRVKDLPPVLRKAREAPRLRGLNEVLGVELQPEELLTPSRRWQFALFVPKIAISNKTHTDCMH